MRATDWRGHQEGKQAEFLVEKRFPWRLVTRIGVHSQRTYGQVSEALQQTRHRPKVEVLPAWYY